MRWKSWWFILSPHCPIVGPLCGLFIQCTLLRERACKGGAGMAGCEIDVGVIKIAMKVVLVRRHLVPRVNPNR